MLMVCNSYGLVSIPKRVSEALKLEIANAQAPNRFFVVSIPKRVSEALKLTWSAADKWLRLAVFQSLKGFQRL